MYTKIRNEIGGAGGSGEKVPRKSLGKKQISR